MSDQKDEEAVLVRPAGLLERYFITRHYLKIDTGVMFAAQFAHNGQKRLDKATLYPALCHLLDREPALTLRLVNERSNSPQFARLRSIDLDRVVYFVEDHEGSDLDAFQRLLEKEFLQPFGESEELPLWRFIVLNGEIGVFSYHHVLGDGASGIVSQLGLLSGLNESPELDHIPSDAQSGLWKLNVEDYPDPLPPIEDMTDLTVSWKTLFHAVSQRLTTTARYQSSVWSGHPVPENPTYQNHVRILDLSQSTISRLVSLCRAHKASVTATMYVLAVATLSRLIAAEGTESNYKRIATSVPVSLRNYTKAPITSICVHFSSFHTDAELMPEGFSWKVASEFTKTLHNSLPGCKEELGLLKYVRNYEKNFRRKLGAPRDGGIEVSSIVGSFRVPGSEDGQTNGWRITRAFGVQNDGSMALRMVLTGDPKLGATACITWGGGSVDDAFANAFIQNFNRGLDRLVQDELPRSRPAAKL